MFRQWAGLMTACVLMCAAVWTHAATFSDVSVAGSKAHFHERSIQFPAGTYDVRLQDVFGLGSPDAGEDVLLLASGDRELARLSQSGSGSSSARFSVSTSSHAKLVIDADSIAVPTWVTVFAVGATEPLYTEVFEPASENEEDGRYEFARIMVVSGNQNLHMQLTDFGAQFGAQLPALRAFQNLQINILNSTADAVLSEYCWYRGEAPADKECVDLDADSGAAAGPDIDTRIIVQPGYLSLSIVAEAQPLSMAQLGWQLRHQGGAAIWEDNVMLSPDQSEAIVLGEFTLTEATSVTAALTQVANDTSPFDLFVVSPESVDILQLSQDIASDSDILSAGQYRVMLLSPEGEKGLLALKIGAGNTVLFDDAFSLGAFQRLGEFSLSADASVPVRLRFLEGMNNNEIFVTGDGVGVAAVSGLQQTNAGIALKKARHIVWSPVDPAAADDLYRIQVGTDVAPLAEFWGVTASRLIGFERASNSATKGTVSVRNFEFPSPLQERYRLVVAQGDQVRLKMDLEGGTVAQSESDIDLSPGNLVIALFAERQAESATAIGYRIETSTPPSQPNNSRGSNGSGGKRGGGSVSSFILYVLLVGRFLMLRHSRK